MTRGQIAIITDNGILTSTEFNGSMFPRDDGYGLEVFRDLDDILSESEYRDYIEHFNRENFKYEEELFYECEDDCFNMQDLYFDKWGSDYIYIKNLTGSTQCFTDSDGQKIYLDPDDKVIFNYGSFYAKCEEDIEKRTVYDELITIKNNLSSDMLKNYADIWNACVDYDNTHSDLCLTDRISDANFVDDELLEYLIKENSSSVARLRFFINDTYDDDIYCINGYGNLENVDESDFKNLIDQLTDMIDRSILSSVRGMEME